MDKSRRLAFEAPGNITAFAEANIYHDAIAADVVFATEMNTLMVGLNATMLTLLTPEDFIDMALTSRKVGDFMRRIHDFYLGFYRSVGVDTVASKSRPKVAVALSVDADWAVEEAKRLIASFP